MTLLFKLFKVIIESIIFIIVVLLETIHYFVIIQNIYFFFAFTKKKKKIFPNFFWLYTVYFLPKFCCKSELFMFIALP